MKSRERVVILLICALPLTGCASPVDFLWPTKKLPTTQSYLGHVLPPVNGMYHSLSDTKLETALIPARKAELDAMHDIALMGNGFVESVAQPLSDGMWGLMLTGAAALGLFTPKPGTQSKIIKAGNQHPDDFNA